MQTKIKTIKRINTFIKYRELFTELISRDIKLRYQKNFLGYVWTLLNPLLDMLVLYIVFSSILGRSSPYFAVYLIIGKLLFHFLSTSTSRSMRSITGNASLLKKIYIPKYIFTLVNVTSELIIFFFSLGALVLVIIFTKTPVSLRVLYTIIPIIQVYIFSLGLSFFLAQASVFFRDIEHIWSIITMAWMYLSGIFYSVDDLPKKLSYLITHFNPMHFYIGLFRHFTIGYGMGQGIAVMDYIIWGSAAAFLSLLLGLVSFSYNKDKFILHI